MKLKKSVVAVLLACMTLLLAACGGGTTGPEPQPEQPAAVTPETTPVVEIVPVTIEFWHAMSGGHQEALVALTDRFNAENGKGITVNLVNQGGYGDLSSKLMASVGAKTLPDLAQVYNNWITNYLDAVVPLDDRIAGDFDNYNDILASYRDEGAEYGPIYTLPFNKSTQLYFYNKTKFQELGLNAPTTWEELKQVGTTIYQATGQPAIGYDDLMSMFQQFVMQNGSEFITNGEVKFDSEAGVEAMAFFLDMYHAGEARIAGEDRYHSGPFGNQDVYAYVGSSAGLAYIQPNGFELGVAPLPKGITGAVPQAGTNLALFAQDEAKQNGAWEYMKFLTSTEATTEWAIATGYLPIRTSAFESVTYQAYMAESEATQASFSQAADQYFEPAFEGSAEIRSLISAEVEAAVLEEKTAEQAVADLAAKVRAILK